MMDDGPTGAITEQDIAPTALQLLVLQGCDHRYLAAPWKAEEGVENVVITINKTHDALLGKAQ
jgi:hypothetical protein